MPDSLTDQLTQANIDRARAAEALDLARLEETRNKVADWARFRASDEADAMKNGVYVFDEQVQESSVREAINELDHYSRLNLGKPITVVYCSPGGSVYSGFMLFDFIQELRARGHHITTRTYGYAASMGGVLAQAGDWREVGANSYLMIHEPSSMGIGKASEIKDDADHLKRIVEHMIRIYEPRSTLSAKQLRSKFDRRDWWVDADEALEFGFVDAIVDVPAYSGKPHDHAA